MQKKHLLLLKKLKNTKSAQLCKQMLLAANTDLFNPLVPKADNSECQNVLYPLWIKPVKVN